MENWEECIDDICEDFRSSIEETPTVPIDLHETPTTMNLGSTIVLWLLHFLVSLQRKHTIPAVALNALLKFLSTVFQVLSPFSEMMATVAKECPSSLYGLHKKLGIKNDDFLKYVVCPDDSCCALYTYDESIESSSSHRTTKKCWKPKGRGVCGQELLRKVVLRGDKVAFYPFKTYCYSSLQKSLAQLLCCPGVLSKCSHWKSKMNSEVIEDIYSSKVWKEYQQFNNEPFLSEPNSFGLMLNIDWFCPFKHGRYSVGAIYMCLMNLPREIRFKPENIILIGLIPGPTEPKLTIDPFLRPLVDELMDFWKGIMIPIGEKKALTKVRCALLCVACDLPAGRKVCGFLSHSATLGCSRCMKTFPGQVGQKDYSGLDRSLWQPRTLQRLKQCISEIKLCKATTKRKELISKYGLSFCQIL